MAFLGLLFAAVVLYQVCDFFGTLNHYWVGNSVSVAIVTWLETTTFFIGQQCVVYAVPVLRAGAMEFYSLWLSAFEWFGFTTRTANLTLATIGVILDLCFGGVGIWFFTRRRRRLT